MLFRLVLIATLVVGAVFNPPVTVTATQYCVDAIFGKDTNSGILTIGNRSTCWASSNGVQTHINGGSIQAGDHILYCRGNQEYQGGLLIQGTSSPIGSEKAPVVFGSYDCRDTQNGTIIYPLPMVTRAHILPQSTFSPNTQWHNVSWTYANGTVGWALSYNLTALVQTTGNQFVPPFSNRNSNGVTVLGGLWINGVQYVEARYPNRVNPNVTHGNNTNEYMLLDPTRRVNSTTGQLYTLSNQTDLFLSLGSWCQMKHVLYGKNEQGWIQGASQDNYYSSATTVYRANDFIVQQANPIGTYKASTVNCSLFVEQLVNCTSGLTSSVPCALPLNYTWDTDWIKTIPVPSTLANDPRWQPTHFYNMGGDTSFYINWYFNESLGASGYGGWSMGQILVNHRDFFDAPQEYLIQGDTIYIHPANDYHAKLLMTNYDPSVIPFTQTGFAHSLVDQGIQGAFSVVLFAGGVDPSAIFGMVGFGGTNQYFELREWEFRYGYGSVYTFHCAEFNLHHTISRYMVSTAITISGGGIDTTNSSDNTVGNVMSFMMYDNVVEYSGGGLYVTATTLQIVNNTFSNICMEWGVTCGYVAVLNPVQWGTFWGNTIDRAGYVGVATGALVDVAFNTFNHTNAIHLDGGPITTNGVIEWNLVGSVDTNMLSGIVGGGSVGLSRGIYGLSDRSTFVNNLLFNVSGQCVFGGENTVPLTMENNICVNAGWQIAPFPATLEVAQGIPQVYNNNSIYYTHPTLDSDVEYWQLPYQPPTVALSRGGRSLIDATNPGYALFNGTYLCIGLVEPLTPSVTNHVISAIINAQGETAIEFGTNPNITLSSSSASGMQFALSTVSLPYGPSYLTSIESYIKNAESWAQTNGQNTIFEFGQSHCRTSLDNTVKSWVEQRNQVRSTREPQMLQNMTALISSDYVFPTYWPWPAHSVPVNVSTLGQGGHGTGTGVPVWAYRGCFQEQPARAIPTQIPGAYSTPQQCQQQAVLTNPLFDTIGLQSGSQCWAGINPNYAQWGAVLCLTTFGSAWQNQVYQLTTATVIPPPIQPPPIPVRSGHWVYVGCFMDAEVRAIPNELSGNIGTLENCQELADAGSYNVLGLQSGAQCWAGTNSHYALYGAVIGGCSGLFGGAWQNQVYQFVLSNQTAVVMM